MPFQPRLSMDYHVFIISRIRESLDHGMSTDKAVEHGIKNELEPIAEGHPVSGCEVKKVAGAAG